jgi:hypothetical protein
LSTTGRNKIVAEGFDGLKGDQVMNSFRILLALALMCGTAGIASADVLMLKNGQAITGKYVGGDETSVAFSSEGRVRTYPVGDVTSITFAATPPATSSSSSAPSYSSGRTSGGPLPEADEPPVLRRTTPATPTPSPTTASSSASRSADEPPVLRRTRPEATTTSSASTSTPARLNVTIPAGAEITVRMIDAVDSSVNQIGETFRASLDEPIVVNGQTIVPRGGDVTAKLTEVAQAGRVAGRSEVSLVLLDITINGRKHEVTTAEVYEAGASRGKQTATRVGAGAAIGAVIGAIAGGGGGAARGAAAGAGAGTAIQVLTKGEKVQIPAEARLVFTLQNPLNL